MLDATSQRQEVKRPAPGLRSWETRTAPVAGGLFGLASQEDDGHEERKAASLSIESGI